MAKWTSVLKTEAYRDGRIEAQEQEHTSREGRWTSYYVVLFDRHGVRFGRIPCRSKTAALNLVTAIRSAVFA